MGNERAKQLVLLALEEENRPPMLQRLASKLGLGTKMSRSASASSKASTVASVGEIEDRKAES
jgi:hypothetical protein